MAITRLGPNQSVNLASNVTGTLPAANGGSGRTVVTGNVLQVVSSESTTVDTFQNVDWTNSSISVSITPSNSSNKIYILASVTASHGNHGNLRLTKDGSAISVGASSSSRPAVAGYMNLTGDNAAGCFVLQSLHSAGGTSAITYRVQVKSDNSSSTAGYINRTVNDTDAVYGGRSVSIITAMEISA